MQKSNYEILAQQAIARKDYEALAKMVTQIRSTKPFPCDEIGTLIEIGGALRDQGKHCAISAAAYELAAENLPAGSNDEQQAAIGFYLSISNLEDVRESLGIFKRVALNTRLGSSLEFHAAKGFVLDVMLLPSNPERLIELEEVAASAQKERKIRALSQEKIKQLKKAMPLSVAQRPGRLARLSTFIKNKLA